jgi:hypothetical protein
MGGAARENRTDRAKRHPGQILFFYYIINNKTFSILFK